MIQHLDEDLELYALGLLQGDERSRVETHVASCVQCARRVGAAENVVEKLTLAFPTRVRHAQQRGPLFRQTRVTLLAGFRGISPWAAAAASFAFAIGVTVFGSPQTHRLQVQANSDDAILATIATSHFNHAQFSKESPAVPTAKLLNARHGEWLYVIIDAADPNLRVIGRDGGTDDFGLARVHGQTTTLFVRNPGTMARVEIQRDGVTIESAVPSYRDE